MFKRTLLVATVAACSFVAGCGEEKKEATVELTTTEQKISYIIGRNIGSNFKQQEIGLDVDVLAVAIKEALADAPQRLTDEEIQTVMTTFQEEQQQKMMAMQEKQRQERDALGVKNKAEGEAFLAANKAKEGVTTLESGIQIKELQAGTGAKPTAEDTVTVHYRGTLIDGTEFDSSYARNEPATFPLANVIPGWTEGLQHMAEGGKYELYIPSDLAYGPGGGGPTIGPNATLIFQIELLKAKAEE